jgi:sugar lactone lactonase YvrE
MAAVAVSDLILHGGILGRAQNLFVANGDSDSIEKFNPLGVGTAFAISGLSGPFGLAFDIAGNLFVANSYVGTAGYSIREFNPSGVVTVFAGPSTGLAQPVGVAFDSKGSLFVANEQNNTIQEFNPLGMGTLFVHSGLNAPTALAFDSAGNLYVANANANNIKKFNSSGVGTVFARLPLGITPAYLAFDSTGVLFATTSQDTIEKFNSAGTGTVFASSGLAVPNGLAFEPAPVPEPPAWALLLCALGALLARQLGPPHGVPDGRPPRLRQRQRPVADLDRGPAQRLEGRRQDQELGPAPGPVRAADRLAVVHQDQLHARGSRR